jgi:hypothetical protein
MLNQYRCQKCRNVSKSFWFWKIYRCRWIEGPREHDFCYGRLVWEPKPSSDSFWSYLKYAAWIEDGMSNHLLALLVLGAALLSNSHFFRAFEFLMSLVIEVFFLSRAWWPSYRRLVDAELLKQKEQLNKKWQPYPAPDVSYSPTNVRVEEEWNAMSDWDDRFEQAQRRNEQ